MLLASVATLQNKNFPVFFDLFHQKCHVHCHFGTILKVVQISQMDFTGKFMLAYTPGIVIK